MGPRNEGRFADDPPVSRFLGSDPCAECPPGGLIGVIA